MIDNQLDLMGFQMIFHSAQSQNIQYKSMNYQIQQF